MRLSKKPLVSLSDLNILVVLLFKKIKIKTFFTTETLREFTK